MTLLPESTPGFWAGVCHAVVLNVRALLRAAGEPVTPENVARVLERLPCRSDGIADEEWPQSFCSACLSKLSEKEPVTAETNALGDFFALWVPLMHPATLRMLSESIVGVLRVAPLKEGV